MRWLADRLVPRCEGRLPNRTTATIGGQPAMWRWELIKPNRWLNVYVHKFIASDEGRAMHDHPWWGVSIILRGKYVDVGPKGRRIFCAGQWLLRPARRPHRIELIDGQPCWTLFICGPRVREWGFHCPAGWRSWREFNAANGCGDL